MKASSKPALFLCLGKSLASLQQDLCNSCINVFYEMNDMIKIVFDFGLFFQVLLFLSWSHSRFFLLILRRQHYRRRASNFDLYYSALMAVEQWGFYIACHIFCDTGTRDTHLLPSSGAVTTCFNELGLWRLGFKHPTFRMLGESSNWPLHRCGNT